MSKCETNGCAEVQQIDGQVHVTSTRRDGAVVLDVDEWLSFVDDVKAGKYDRVSGGTDGAASTVDVDDRCAQCEHHARFHQSDEVAERAGGRYVSALAYNGAAELLDAALNPPGDNEDEDDE